MNPPNRPASFLHQDAPHPSRWTWTRLRSLTLAAIVVSICAFTPPPWPLTILALLVVLRLHGNSSFPTTADLTRADVADWFDTLLLLARDPTLSEHHRSFSDALRAIAQRPGAAFRQAALERLAEVLAETERVARGTLVYEDTETWRISYARVLRTPGVHRYRSVAWIRNPHYWQDEPGLQSMRLNFQLRSAGLDIERIVIIADSLWPAAEALPTEQLRQWIHEQHAHGIGIKLVRESALATEPDLLADLGIYGTLAVGCQELDERCRTVRFTLRFDYEAVAAAEERWSRLSVYAAAYQDLLDHFSLYDYDQEGTST